jgi:hypothetical protein
LTARYPDGPPQQVSVGAGGKRTCSDRIADRQGLSSALQLSPLLSATATMKPHGRAVSRIPRAVYGVPIRGNGTGARIGAMAAVLRYQTGCSEERHGYEGAEGTGCEDG